MKQAAFRVATGPDSGLLLPALKLMRKEQPSNFTDQAHPFYQSLVYQLNKEDEFDKTLYQDEVLDDESDDAFDNDEENANNSYEEDYEFDYHRHK